MNVKYEVRIYLPGLLAYAPLKSKGFCWRLPNFSVHLIFRRAYQATECWVLFLSSGPGLGVGTDHSISVAGELFSLPFHCANKV